ncbi:MAG: DHH family phosphoesterase [Candidatus Pacearchaeota archaeon]
MERKNNSFEEIWNTLKDSKKVLITLHPKPDGDSQGSCIAMKTALEKEGVEVRLISRDQVNENLKGFYSDEIEFEKKLEDFDLEEFEFIIFLDHGTLGGHSEEIINSERIKEKMVNIDHHETNSFYGKMNYVNSNAPSCASVLVEMFKEIGVEFDNKICRALLLGICTDTNFGEYRDSADSLEKMAFLVKKGEINFQKEFVIPILRSDSWELKKFHGILLTNMERKVIGGKNIFYSYATKDEWRELGLEVSDLRLGVICMQGMAGWDLIFILTELEGEIKGSFRSKDLDTTIYSKALGGGGHQKASAFLLETTDMKKSLGKVLKTIEEKGFVDA